MGLPPSLASGSDLRDIAQLCHDYPYSLDFAAQIDIQRHLAKFCVALKECKEHTLRMSLIRLFSGELDDTCSEYRGKWAVETELQFLGAKMFLYGFSFRSRNRNPEVSDSTTASEMNSSLHVLLYEAMGVATKMIYIFSELKDQDDDGSHFETPKFPPQIFFPKHYIFSFCYACLVLYHFLEVNTQVPKSEQDLARNHVGFAYSTLSRCGTENNVEVARLAQWLELMGKWNRSNRVVPHVTSRLGAPLFYESVLKNATLKAEMGSRSRSADLSRPFDEEQRKETGERGETAPRQPKSQNREGLIPPEQQQQHGLVGDINDQYSWQGWEDQLQGWDLSILKGVDFTDGMDAGNSSRKNLY